MFLKGLKKIGLCLLAAFMVFTSVVFIQKPVEVSAWGPTFHRSKINQKNNPKMFIGATFQDVNKTLQGMKERDNGSGGFPQFHGYAFIKGENESNLTGNTGKCNYIANYVLMINVAEKYYENLSYDAIFKSITPNVAATYGVTTYDYNMLKKGFKIIDTEMKNQKLNPTQKRGFVYGVAMHHATDAIAHSGFAILPSINITSILNPSYSRITHAPTQKANLVIETAFGTHDADNVNYIPARKKMAEKIMDNVIKRHNGPKGKAALKDVYRDFYVNDASFYKASSPFRLKNLESFAKAAGEKDPTVLARFAVLSKP